jgi:hypothetical protein
MNYVHQQILHCLNSALRLVRLTLIVALVNEFVYGLLSS